jgi:hypothetical protein
MFQWIKTFVFDFEFNSLLGLVLYWVPCAICVVGYMIKNVIDYRADLKNRSYQHYNPNLTVGIIVLRAMASTIPVVNLWNAVIQFSPDFMGAFIDTIAKVFSVPLVPRTYKPDSSKNDPAHEAA